MGVLFSCDPRVVTEGRVRVWGPLISEIRVVFSCSDEKTACFFASERPQQLLFFFISRPVPCINLIRYVAVFDFRQLSENWRALCNRAGFMCRLVWFSSASPCSVSAVTIIVTPRRVWISVYSLCSMRCLWKDIRCANVPRRNVTANLQMWMFACFRFAARPSFPALGFQQSGWPVGYSGVRYLISGGKGDRGMAFTTHPVRVEVKNE